MPIIQDRDVKFPYKRYTYYLQAYQAKSNCVPVVPYIDHSRSFGVGNETAQVRILACFFFFFFLHLLLFVCVCVEMVKGLIIFCI